MSRFLRRFAVVRLVCVVLCVCATGLAATSCKPKVGRSCKAGDGACTSETESLTCGADHTFVTMACKGPAGCSADNATRRVTCDRSIADEGDACSVSATENFACSADKAKVLKCDAGKFATHQYCRGPKGCSLQHDSLSLRDDLSCDTTVQNKGDPCLKQGIVVCSTDRKQMLQCNAGVFDLYRYCRGATGCQTQKEGPHCDELVAEEGDPCRLAGLLVCATDGKSELICRSGKFLHERECRKSGCHLTARNGIDCN